MASDDATVSAHFRPVSRGLSTTPPAQAADASLNESTATADAEYAPSFIRASMLMRKATSPETIARQENVVRPILQARQTSTKEMVKRARAVRPKKQSVVSEEYVLDSDDDTGVREENAKNATTTTKVMARRRSWTPLEDTAQDSDAEDDMPLADRLGFTKLVNSCAYPDGPNAPVVRPAKRRKTTTDKPPKEKKPLAPAKPRTVKPKMPKAPAVPKVKKAPKKLQTITALATAPYRPQVVESSEAQRTIPEVLTKAQDEASASVAIKRKRKSTTTVKKSTKPKTPLKDMVPRVLLGPTQAQASMSNQVFIFGTSSQLHVEDSPLTIQQIQTALHHSEMSPGSEAVSPAAKSKSKVPTAPHGTSLSAGQADRDLWCVAARDHNGGIMAGEAESQDSRIDSVCGQQTKRTSVITLADLPQPTTTQSASFDEQQSEKTSTKIMADLPLPITEKDNFVLISSDPPEPTAEQKRPCVIPNSTIHPPLSPSLPPWPSAQRSVLQPLDANLHLRSPAATRFKSALSPIDKSSPRRGRPRKVQDTVTISSSPTTLFQQGKTTSPSKILERLQSSPPGSWHDIDQILDDEVPPTPTPPRKQTVVVEPQALEFEDQSAETVQPAGLMQPAPKDVEVQGPAIYAKLFPRITATIKAIPRSNSLTHPTWHEKILLYDPIVIEDLTLWLNSQGLRIKVLKKGRKKKAVLEPEVEEVEEELSHQMVQKWCEENSICCLWKEGLRGGVRTRY